MTPLTQAEYLLICFPLLFCPKESKGSAGQMLRASYQTTCLRRTTTYLIALKIKTGWLIRQPPSCNDDCVMLFREKLKGNNQRAPSFHNFYTFSQFFTFSHHFSPRTFPFKTKGFSSRRTKEKKIIKRTDKSMLRVSCCTFVLLLVVGKSKGQCPGRSVPNCVCSTRHFFRQTSKAEAGRGSGGRRRYCHAIVSGDWRTVLQCKCFVGSVPWALCKRKPLSVICFLFLCVGWRFLFVFLCRVFFLFVFLVLGSF